MNVLHLNTYDIGGAAYAAYRLHKNLLEAGFDSKMMVLTKQQKDTDVIPFYDRHLSYRVRVQLDRFTRKKLAGDSDYFFQDNAYSYIGNGKKLLEKLPFKPDIIIAHWISNFITAEHLYRLSASTAAPIVWHLLDMAPLTGGCHYAWDCTGYRDHCGMCPALYSKSANDLSFVNFKKKSFFVDKMDITIVPASGRLLEQSQTSALFKGRRIEKILLAVDSEIFKPLSREHARARLNLPLDRKVIFFGAYSIKERRKGLLHLQDALNALVKKGLDRHNVLFVTAGNEPEIMSSFKDALPHAHLGYLCDDKSLATAFQAADLFVCPSIEDSGPMMINEAIMCGTPVVSFDMGVAPDLVHTGKTGYRAKLKDSSDLAAGIKYVLDLPPESYRAMSEECRNMGLALCHPGVQTRAFGNIFDSLTGKERVCRQ